MFYNLGDPSSCCTQVKLGETQITMYLLDWQPTIKPLMFLKSKILFFIHLQTALFFILCVMISGKELLGQNNIFNARMTLSVLDTANNKACYNLELSNGGNVDWIVGSFNLIFLYDASVASFTYDSLLVNDIVYDQQTNASVTSTTNSSLPYRDSLGFVRVNLSSVDQSAMFDSARLLLDTFGTWSPTVQLCFDLKINPITSPNTCLQINFSTPELQSALSIPPNFMQEWAGGNILVDVLEGILLDVIPDRRYNSCFVIEEDTEELCTDGIDNDLDGLTDCMDLDGCSPGSIRLSTTLPTCVLREGSIQLNGGGLGVRYSIDGGMTFVADSIFSPLLPGVYDVIAQRGSIETCAFSELIILNAPQCDEFDEASCMDGIDNDGDGLIDCDDPDCQPVINSITVVIPDNCLQYDNGSISFTTNSSDVEWSIDGGQTFAQENTIDSLGPETYNLVFRNAITLCLWAQDTTIRIVASDSICLELPEMLCDDGIDNDNDGLIDCADSDCLETGMCIDNISPYMPNVIRPGSLNNGRLEIITQNNQVWTILEFEVYDRWGNLVHQRSNTTTGDVNHGWNGRFNNQRVSDGVYFYMAVITLGEVRIPLSGDVTVIN